MPFSIGREEILMATTGKAADTGSDSGAGDTAGRAAQPDAPATGPAAGSGAGADARPPTAPAPDGPGEPDAKLADLEDRWRRALADLDNLRKRYARELERERATERARVAASWLPVLDNLELALGHAGADASQIVEGVRAIRDQAVEALARLGYPRREEVGVPFDPSRHEVVTVVDESDAPPGTVVQVLRPGYGEDDHQLRPMAVAVSKPRE
jgi:molecular chaperone GrpE